MKIHLTLLLIILPAVMAACGGDDDDSTTLTVFAAASLTDAFEALAEAFEAQNEGIDVRLNFASSSALATQIIEGADADIFASANPQQMQNVADAGQLNGDAQTLAVNHLVLTVNAESALTAIADLTAEDVTVVIAAPGVPIRGYMDEALALMDASGDFGDDFSVRMLANVVSEEANVRAAALKVALGEADATFTYASDITPDIRDDVRTIDIPDDYNVLATYLLAPASENPLAEQFIDFLLSEAGQAILVEWGFTSASE